MGLTALGVLLVPVGFTLGVIGTMGGRPEGFLFPFVAFEKAADNAKENRATRVAALKSCLEPFRLQQTLGPEHPDVAWGLSGLADGYVSIGELAKAEPLYQRALAIQEKTPGEEHQFMAEIRLAATLEH